MPGRSAQRKGANGERELAAILAGFGFDAQRGGSMTYGLVPDVVGIDGIHVECKRVEKLDLPSAIRQAQRDAERFGDGLPAVFHRGNRQKWIVSMPLESWLQLYGKRPKAIKSAQDVNSE